MPDRPDILAREVKMERITTIKRHPENVRKGNVDVIRESIRENGYFVPVIVQVSSRKIIAGEHRWRAAKAEGLQEIPVIWLDVDDIRAQKMRLVENRSNDAAGYDDAALLAILQRMAEDDTLLGTGFSDVDVEILLARHTEVNADLEAFGGITSAPNPFNRDATPEVGVTWCISMSEEERDEAVTITRTIDGETLADKLLTALRAFVAR